MTVVITGGSGLIGTVLSKSLLDKGNTVIIIDRQAPHFTHQNLYFIQCNLEDNLLPFNVLERTDAVIHLAGKNIFSKWNKKTKEEIKNSRIKSTKHIIESIKQTNSKPSIFISASAVGFYGDKGNTEVDEHSQKGDTFLSDVVFEWEKEALKAQEIGCRVVVIRTAPVISPNGFLKTLIKLAKFGFILSLTKKDFWMPWIHINDIVGVYIFALETGTLQGIINASSPNPIKHSDFIKVASKVLKRRVFGNVPEFIAKRKYGDLFFEMISSQRVLPKRLLDKGFSFEYTNIEGAIRNIRDLLKKRQT